MRRLSIVLAVLAVALTSGAAARADGTTAVTAPDPARTVAEGAAAKLEAAYVYPSRAREAAELVRRNAAQGAYDGLRDGALAGRVTADLATVLHDKHVRLEYSADVLPQATSSKESPEQRAAFEAFMREAGYGLGRVAHAPGNVGYLDVRFFPESDAAPSTVFDGMVNALAYSDAIIIDLRRNHGGSPGSIARLLSHFLPPKTHVNDFVGRGDGEARVVESTYTGAVPGPRITAPVYVLTSHETFSGGEECAYDFQALERGTLIGEVTGGGANPGHDARIDDHFEIFVPTERARNPITMTNWEGVGVKPDLPTARDRALATAYGMALDAKLKDASLSTAERTRLTELRPKVDAMSDAEILSL